VQIKTIENITIEGVDELSILDNALSNGVFFEYSCKNGQCGICKTQLLNGDVKEIQPQLALSETEKESGKILTCCCSPRTNILIESENLSALCDIKIQVLPARIKALRQLSDSIIEVVLRLPPTASFKFLEGQYVDIIGPNSVKRSYSVASSSYKSDITFIIKKVDTGVFSNYWFNDAKVNDLMRIEGPKGTFFVRNQDQELIFLATGTGIAPIRAILESFEENGSYKQKKPIKVFWGNREEKNIIWAPSFKNVDVEINFVLSKPEDNWDGVRGYVQNVALDSIASMDNIAVYACGSNQMITAAKDIFMKAGLKESKFFSDAFLKTN